VFRTYTGEPVSFQIGTASGPDAVLGASVVAGDVQAIDVNMGCPKHFSIQGAMTFQIMQHMQKSCH
jgi:tRNA-dihydrouridine synthase 2